MLKAPVAVSNEMSNQPQHRLKICVKRRNSPVLMQVATEFPVVFGRGKDCDIQLRDFSFISRAHGAITVEEGRIRVCDLNSQVGILYQGKQNFDFIIDRKGLFQVQDLSFELELEVDLSPYLDMGPQAQRLVLKREQSTVQNVQNLASNKTQSGKWSIEPDEHCLSHDVKDLCFQAVVTWANDVYDVRNFYYGDVICLGGKTRLPIYIPFFRKKVVLGNFSSQGGRLALMEKYPWNLYANKQKVALEQLQKSERISHPTTKKSVGNLIVFKNEVFSARINHDVMIHFRYVTKPRPFIRKSWMDNREEIKRAITTSLVLHVLVTMAILIVVPKTKVREIPNVPTRIAKLLAEPPPTLLAPPKPVIIPPPAPIPKLRELPKPPPMVVPPKIAKQVKARRANKFVRNFTPKQQTKFVKTKNLKEPDDFEMETIPEIEPIEDPGQIQANALANIFSRAPVSKVAPLNMDSSSFKSSARGNALSGTSENALGKLAMQAKSNSGIDYSGSSPDVSKIGYAASKVSGNTGKRAVKGIVGSPKMVNQLNTEQGLDNQAVMKVVNKHVGEIQRCYERSLFDNPSLAGRIEYEWDIGPGGDVSDVRVKKSDMAAADKLNECVMGVLRTMRFPRAPNGLSTLATIGFPFGRN